MALEVKMKRDESSESISSSGSESVIRILRGMLRTGYGFAKDIPEKVHIYCSIDKENKSANFDVLFSVKENLYSPQDIHESDTSVEWDTSEKRVMSLYQYLGDDLLNKIIPTLKASFKEVPDAIQTSYDIDNDTQITFFNYGVQSNSAREQWRESVHSPENGSTMNMVEFDYLNIEEGF